MSNNKQPHIGQGVVIIGTQFGDEGKGKIVDYYCSKAEIDSAVRFNGGSNAGHTIVVGGTKHALHILPSSIVYGKPSYIGNGVVVNPQILLRELEQYPKHANFLRMDRRCHLVLGLHLFLDQYQENMKTKEKIAAGTTKQGIGPVYADKANRLGIRWAEAEDKEQLDVQLRLIYEYYSKILEKPEIPDITTQKETIVQSFEKLKKSITDVGEELEKKLKEGKNILFEGAQSTLLDIDHGIYPYSTSSTCTAAGAASGTGIGPQWLSKRIGVMKAYTSRVGEGPFLGELDTKVEPGSTLQQKGGEYGTTTGRPRRVGWLDLVAVKYSVRVNGLTGLAITKLDILGLLPKFKVITAYLERDGVEKANFPARIGKTKEMIPKYEEFTSWGTITVEEWKAIIRRGSSGIPKLLRQFVDFCENFLNCRVHLLSFGPDRELTLELIPLGLLQAPDPPGLIAQT
ncbi:MAG TPA: adenylosuccinate synthase [Candidatus Hodarchaeales archaeon]|nr:adenylosuccinate synthase [Candidatus Hodarchaeales archaeon]